MCISNIRPEYRDIGPRRSRGLISRYEDRILLIHTEKTCYIWYILWLTETWLTPYKQATITLIAMSNSLLRMLKSHVQVVYQWYTTCGFVARCIMAYIQPGGAFDVSVTIVYIRYIPAKRDIRGVISLGKASSKASYIPLGRDISYTYRHSSLMYIVLDLSHY